MAIVDLQSKKFKVMEVKKQTGVEEAQKSMGVRSHKGNSPISAKSSEKEILQFINKDIRSKYFKGEKVKCIDYKKTQNGYTLIYQRANGEKVGYDVTIDKKDGNLLLNYQMFLENT